MFHYTPSKHRGEIKVNAVPLLTPILGGWSEPGPGRFIPWNKTQYALHRRLGGHRGRSGLVRKIPPPPPGFETGHLGTFTSINVYINASVVKPGNRKFMLSANEHVPHSHANRNLVWITCHVLLVY